MPRPRKTLRPISKNIHLPEDIVLQTELHLHSDLEGRVPYGAWQALIEKLLREYFDRAKQQAEFAAAMNAVPQCDKEAAHAEMDRLMREQLIKLNFIKNIETFRRAPRWYV